MAAPMTMPSVNPLAPDGALSLAIAPPVILDFPQETEATGAGQAPSEAVGTATDPTGTEPSPPQGPPGGFLIPGILMFAIFYFLLIRPEKRRRKAAEEMVASLKKGDEVMTNGGMYARVAAIHDDRVTLEVADGVRVRFARAAIQSVVAKEPEAGATA